MSYFKVTAQGAGRLTRNPDLYDSEDKRTGETVKKAVFTVATGFGEFARFHRCEAYGPTAEKAFEKLRRGTLLMFEGTPKTRLIQRKEADGSAVEEFAEVIRVRAFVVLAQPQAKKDAAAQDQDTAEEPAEALDQDEPAEPDEAPPADDEEIPF
jgi:single-stranded DNA-binding protein